MVKIEVYAIKKVSKMFDIEKYLLQKNDRINFDFALLGNFRYKGKPAIAYILHILKDDIHYDNYCLIKIEDNLIVLTIHHKDSFNMYALNDFLEKEAPIQFE